VGVTNDTFGPLFVPASLERSMLTLLETWLPVYLAEIERQNDLATCTIARPRSYATSVEADLEPGEQLPAIIAISPGTIAAPEREADEWTAWWQLTVVALVMTPAEISTRELAGMYAAAIRGVVLQHAGLDNALVEATWWDGEEYQGEPGSDRNRTRGAALVNFRVKIGRGIVDTTAGPVSMGAVADPCTDEFDPPATVQTVHVDVESDDLP